MTVERKCDWCGNIYPAKTADLKRGWGRCCCKSCAASVKSFGKRFFDKTYETGAKKKRYYERPSDFESNPFLLTYDDEEQDVFSEMNV
ncbi:MAG: hypothetical protein LBC19_13705 [Tannerella sp.]|jgi:hypothetical protein|nr:hypothetical protein [Tannerella sp.]